MSYGFIDSAFLMNVVSGFTLHDANEEWGNWEWESLTQLTQALIHHHYLKIAPSPSPSSLGITEVTYDPLYSYYDLACKKLAGIEENPQIDPTQKNIAKQEFRKWFNNNTDEAINAINEAKKEEGYNHWEKWTIPHAWVDHSYRLQGLFDIEMIRELSFVLQIPQKNLKKLWKKTADIHQVKMWSKGKNLDNDFDLAKDAFIASAILRGKYHHIIATLEGWDIMPHPMRQHFMIPFSKGDKYEISWIAEYFSHIIFNSAMTEQKPQDRILHWTKNIQRAQEAYFGKEINELDNLEFNESEGFEQAQITAKKINIKFYSHLLEEQIDAALRSGILLTTGVTGIYFLDVPWSLIPIVIGGIADIIKEKKKPSRKIAQTLTSTKKNLCDLATSKPGLIVKRWKY